MASMPKRRKSKDNPYKLNYIEEQKIYTISFKDDNNTIQEVEIPEEIFNVFNEYELEDISQMHKKDKYIDIRVIDNTENTDIYLHYNTKHTIKKSIEEIVEDKMLKDSIKETINKLPEIQKRRIKKYYFENMTYEEIAKEENCSKRAVKFSIDIAIEKISKKFKK